MPRRAQLHPGNPREASEKPPEGPEDAGLMGNLQKQLRTWVPSGPRVSPSPQRRLGRDSSGPVNPTVPTLCCPRLCLPGGSTGPGWCWGPLSQPLHPHAGLGLPLLPPLAPAQGKPPEPVLNRKKKQKKHQQPSSRMQSQLLSERNNAGILHGTFSISGEKGLVQGNSCSSRTKMSDLCLEAGSQGLFLI